MSLTREFDIKSVNRALIGTRFAARLHHFPTIDSTNTRLLADAANAPEGTVYLADEQTAGRGRSNHQWHSEAGSAAEPAGLYLSALITLPLPLRQALWLSLATGLAVQQAVFSMTAIRPDIRWPNDILLGHQKLGGILVETAVEAATLRHAVIGIGLNLNQPAFPPDLAPIATSLRLATGVITPREPLVIALLRALDLELTLLESGGETGAESGGETGAHTLLDRFAAASTWVRGKPVQVAEQGGYTGITDGLNPDGFLRVLTADGTIRTVLSGGVREA